MSNELDPIAHESYYDPATGALVVSEIDPRMVEGDIMSRVPANVQRALASWAEDISSGGRRRDRSLFERNKYVTPGRIFEQMAVAYEALDDDIVGNVADTSEAIAFQKMRFESEEKDQEDVWNQIARDLDLDSWVRQAWRELFTVSQFYGIRWWGTKEYKVRGKTESGNEKRKTYVVHAPVGLGFLDPTRVVPVRNDVFGRSQLAWIASPDEMGYWTEENDDSFQTDELVSQLFLGPYQPSSQEEAAFAKENIPTDRLMLLNPTFVFRHTLTKSSYERWTKLRMKSIFPILDLKHQLREMDRTWLLGGINFVVLVTRGSDDIPTTKAEVDQTAAQVRSQSRSPIIVSDHRIKIEIITPDVAHVLNEDKWAVLDERIMMRLWGTFQLPSETSSRETSLTLGRVIARGLASRRHMLKRTIEREIIRPTVTHPLNRKKFDGETKIEFSPRRMELEFDAALVTMLQELRDRGDISRETVLQEFNFDQKLEAQRREWEDERFKDVFKPVNVPFDSPNRTTPGGSGRQGGRPAGTPNPEDPQGGDGDNGNAQR